MQEQFELVLHTGGGQKKIELYEKAPGSQIKTEACKVSVRLGGRVKKPCSQSGGAAERSGCSGGVKGAVVTGQGLELQHPR